MSSLIQKFKDLFTKPDGEDHRIIEKWKKESDEGHEGWHYNTPDCL